VTRWIIATRSPGKLRELSPMLASRGIIAIGLDDAGVPHATDEEMLEAFDTFEANALAKARHFAAITGVPCLADDSGLCIDALDGRPGVRSRRFAADLGRAAGRPDDEDAENNDALLDACWNSGWAPPWAAHYACAAAFVHRGQEHVVLGRTDGSILPERDGTGGFGYDPFFLSADLGMTFARASRDAKATVSHRGRAFSALLEMLTNKGLADSAR
jgi:XTP/dITP diphosphohydrolase